MGIKMAPSIMCAHFGELADSVRALEEGGADMLHFDVMDGHFVPNFTMGAKVLRDLRPLTAMPFDVHLSVEQPERFIDMFADAGANSIAVHVESTTVLLRTIDLIHKRGLLATVALSPATPVSNVLHVLGEVDRVMPLTVDPGFSGGRFVSSVMDKIVELKALIRHKNLPVEIQGSGHITPEVAAKLIKVGVDILVLGTSSIFRPGADLATELRAFRSFCNAQLAV